ncbi:MAG: hypothetical protein ACRDPY_45145 [Streptosporangiaceae bacterium]
MHHREGVRSQRVFARQGSQEHVVTGPQPAAVAQWAGITMYGLPSTVTMPPGSRREIITPASAVRVSRSPPRQPSAAMVARSATRPEASIRPKP